MGVKSAVDDLLPLLRSDFLLSSQPSRLGLVLSSASFYRPSKWKIYLSSQSGVKSAVNVLLPLLPLLPFLPLLPSGFLLSSRPSNQPLIFTEYLVLSSDYLDCLFSRDQVN